MNNDTTKAKIVQLQTELFGRTANADRAPAQARSQQSQLRAARLAA
jgi:hypothetical protein